ncbi:hypothetical protein [Xylanimonas sp. McL0601]|uniref:hypothetical protein n=1 Tax=Xylanimonas sp. McL0601 TaxID=3414739 RepID=UPI003CF32954
MTRRNHASRGGVGVLMLVGIVVSNARAARRAARRGRSVEAAVLETAAAVRAGAGPA